MFIACYNIFYSSQPVLAIGIFDQDVDLDHALKFMIFGKNMLGTVENVTTGDKHILIKYL